MTWLQYSRFALKRVAVNAVHQSRSYKVLQSLTRLVVQKCPETSCWTGSSRTRIQLPNMSQQVMPRGQCGSISCIIVVSNENDFGLRVGEPPGGLALLSFVHRAECQMFEIDLPSGLQMEMEASK